MELNEKRLRHSFDTMMESNFVRKYIWFTMILVATKPNMNLKVQINVIYVSYAGEHCATERSND